MSLCIELNEINFDYIQKYIKRRYLKNFKKIIENYGITDRVPNKNLKDVELQPWIQSF